MTAKETPGQPVAQDPPGLVDELQFVDEDVRRDFVGRQYMAGMPLTVQLIREIRLLRSVMLGNAAQ